jgi:hypothetical protein
MTAKAISFHQGDDLVSSNYPDTIGAPAPSGLADFVMHNFD